MKYYMHIRCRQSSPGEVLAAIIPRPRTSEVIPGDPPALILCFGRKLLVTALLNRQELANMYYYVHKYGFSKPPYMVILVEDSRGTFAHPVLTPVDSMYHDSWSKFIGDTAGETIEQSLGAPAELQYCMWYCGYPADITGLLERAALEFV